MVGLPVVALGTQPKGGLSLTLVRQHVAECRSRRRYQITCFECPVAVALPPHAHVTQWAYERAKAALEQWPEAQVGIGLHTALVPMFSAGKKPITAHNIVSVRMAGAALVIRAEPDVPLMFSSSENSSRESVRMVARMMALWQKKLELNNKQEPLIFKVVRRAIGLRS